MAGDFTGDGRTDLAVAGYDYNPVTFTLWAVSVLLGNGDGTFQPAVQYATALSAPSAIVAGDFTGDGRLDLAVACYNYDTNEGGVSVLLGNGDGTFQPPVIYAYAVGQHPSAIVAGDFTGDGRSDLAVAFYLVLQGGGSARAA